MEKQYYLKNLGCANCAAKMEREIGKLSEVSESCVSYMNKKLIVSFHGDEETLVQKMQQIVTRIEEQVILLPYDQKDAEGEKEATTGHHHEDGEDHDHHGEHCGCGHHHEDGEDHDHHGEHCECGHHHEDGEDHDHHGEHCGCGHHHEDGEDHDHHENDDNVSAEQGHTRNHGESGDKISKILMLIGAILFVAAFAMDKILGESIATTAMFIIAYVLVGYDVVWHSVKNISHGDIFDEFFLMSIATIGALCIGEYPEAVAVMIFYKAGEFLQDKAVDSARHSIQSLVKMKADSVMVAAADGSLTKKEPKSVAIGEIIEVKPGERVALDGILLSGETTLDMAALTGEGKPVDVSKGEEILSGSVNLSGVIRVQVTKTLKNSTVSRIMDMVENAADKKSHTEQFITRFARIYTPVVCAIALLLAIVPPIVNMSMGGDPAWSQWIYKALSFLVVSCPCALVISVPLGFFAGIGVASKNGILVKGGNYLEALVNVNAVAFDKTGTLTFGNFKVTKCIPANNVAEADLLENAAYAECKSNHPIAKSIVEAYGKSIDEQQIEKQEEIAGYGICIYRGGHAYYVGNEKLMKRQQISYEKPDTNATLIFVAKDTAFMGVICIADEVKPSSAPAMQKLKKEGIEHTIMLTGDQQSIADEVGKKVGVDIVYGELLPDEKLGHVENLYKENEKLKLAYVGDGINDAPVLARVDVGFAMGGMGQDAAVETADIVLMNDDIGKVATAISIAKYTRQIVTENIILALFIKVLVMVLLACGIATMWMAVFADVGVCLLAVLNSVRVYRFKGKKEK